MKESRTAELVREHVLSNTLVSSFLSLGLINQAALARHLLSRILEENPKATVESISVAISRLEPTQPDMYQSAADVISRMQISMRTELSLLLLDRQDAPIRTRSRSDFFAANLGTEQATIVTDTKNAADYSANDRQDGLSAISLRDVTPTAAQNFRNTPGVIAAYLTQLSLAGINIVDLFTGSKGLHFIMQEEDLADGYHVVRRVKQMHAAERA